MPSGWYYMLMVGRTHTATTRGPPRHKADQREVPVGLEAANNRRRAAPVPYGNQRITRIVYVTVPPGVVTSTVSPTACPNSALPTGD